MFINGLASFALIPYIDNKITHLMLLKSNNNLFFIPKNITINKCSPFYYFDLTRDFLCFLAKKSYDRTHRWILLS